MMARVGVAVTALTVSLLAPSLCASFQAFGWIVRRPPSLLYAKVAKRNKKNSASTSSTGGFGGVSSKKTTMKEEDDFSAFPPLEPGVEQTILSVPDDMRCKGDLPAEIYDRLDQIYGFGRFNYHEIDDREDDAVSFGEMLAMTSSKVEPKSEYDDVRKAAAAVNVLDILAANDGNDPNVSTTPADSPNALHLSSLPPFSDLSVLHLDPLVIGVDKFFTDEECDRYIQMSEAPSSKGNNAPVMTRSKTVGKDALAKAQRTSTTWFHHFKEVPELVSKASRLLGLDGVNHWEEPQTVRYRRNEKFTWHLDALAPSDDLESFGGQRTATLLVYLTDLSADEGGATVFRDLKDDKGEMLRVHPKKGSALLFFPAAGGIPNVPFDIRTLHCGEVVSSDASNDKWISQLWLRKNSYSPTAPPGNSHFSASEAISSYCTSEN